jgi:hypothetical protein
MLAWVTASARVFPVDALELAIIPDNAAMVIVMPAIIPTAAINSINEDPLLFITCPPAVFRCALR